MKKIYSYRCPTCGVRTHLRPQTSGFCNGGTVFWCLDCKLWKKFIKIRDGVIQVLDEVEV
jgi:hypothetical protein